jgi:hypothetical protein
MTKKSTQTGVEHTKGNGEFYFYLYPLGIELKEVFQEIFNTWLMFTHVRPCAPMQCVNYEWIKIQLKVNLYLTKS